jgi:hypothetical protein
LQQAAWTAIRCDAGIKAQWLKISRTAGKKREAAPNRSTTIHGKPLLTSREIGTTPFQPNRCRNFGRPISDQNAAAPSAETLAPERRRLEQHSPLPPCPDTS